MVKWAAPHGCPHTHTHTHTRPASSSAATPLGFIRPNRLTCLLQREVTRGVPAPYHGYHGMYMRRLQDGGGGPPAKAHLQGDNPSVDTEPLRELYASWDGPSWNHTPPASENWNSTSVSVCNWQGVKCGERDPQTREKRVENLVLQCVSIPLLLDPNPNPPLTYHLFLPYFCPPMCHDPVPCRPRRWPYPVCCTALMPPS